ncbi:MAG: DUF2079 domain-containing protein, partial [bacterium]
MIKFSKNIKYHYSIITIIIPLISITAAALGVPVFNNVLTRIIAISAIILTFITWMLFDRWLLEKCSPDQSRRIIQTRLFSLCFLFLPFAMNASRDTWCNLWLDLLSYSGLVCFFSVICASRIEPLIQHIKNPSEKSMFLIFLLISVVYFIILGTQAASSFSAYSSEWVDNSWEFASIWQTARGSIFRMINDYSQETSMLSYHWPLIYILIAPFTVLWSDPRMVLWIYTFCFAFSGFTVYLLAKERTRSKQMGFFIGILFLFYLPVHLANLFDMHADPLAMPFLFLCFYFAEKNKWKPYFVSMILALMCKEYAGLAFLGYGIWLSFRNLKIGIITALTGLSWFIFVINFGVPFFNEGKPPLMINSCYGELGDSKGLFGMLLFSILNFTQVLERIFTQNNIVAMTSLFLPLLFIPLRKPWIILCGILISLKNLLSLTGMNLLNHRETLFSPFVVYALIIYFSEINNKSLKRFRIIAVLFAVITTFFLQG